MSGPELAQVAQSLFGDSWRSAAAAALGISRGTLWRQVAKGPSPDVAATVEAWRRLAGFGVAPPAFPDAPFVGLPDSADCQVPVTPANLAEKAEKSYGKAWRDALGSRFGLTKHALWRQSKGKVSGPLAAGFRAIIALRAIADLDVPMPPPVVPARRGPGKVPKYAALLRAPVPRPPAPKASGDLPGRRR